MRIVVLCVVFALSLTASGCTTVGPSSSSVTVEQELQRLETAKWHPSDLGGRDGVLALFADEFVTVEYGADLNGGVERKLAGKSTLSSPEGGRLIELLDRTTFILSDWRFIHSDAKTIIVSYHVRAPSFAWNAYATSVWTLRGSQWQTVFYQASRAK